MSAQELPAGGAAGTRDVGATDRVRALDERLAVIEIAVTELQSFRMRIESLAPPDGDDDDDAPSQLDSAIAGRPIGAAATRVRVPTAQVHDGAAPASLADAAGFVELPSADEPAHGAAGGPPDAARLAAENDLLRRQAERLTTELEVATRQLDEHKTRAGSAAVDLGSAPVDACVQELVRVIAGERDRLAAEKTRLEADLARMKNEATKKFKELKSERDTVRHQKENLMKQLMARDATQKPEELTVEQITAAPAFQTMLANIQANTRLEVKHLHDTVVALKAVDPKAYNLVLDLAAKQFKKVAMENPLALLPKA